MAKVQLVFQSKIPLLLPILHGRFRTFVISPSPTFSLAGGGYLSNAVPAQLLYDPYGPEDFAAGGMENPDGLSADDALLREILEERYVTFFGQTEGFNDTRRTQKDTGVRVRVQPNTGSELPQRFLYPQTEIDRNANVPSPIPGLFQPTDVNN